MRTPANTTKQFVRKMRYRWTNLLERSICFLGRFPSARYSSSCLSTLLCQRRVRSVGRVRRCKRSPKRGVRRMQRGWRSSRERLSGIGTRCWRMRNWWLGLKVTKLWFRLELEGEDQVPEESMEGCGRQREVQVGGPGQEKEGHQWEKITGEERIRKDREVSPQRKPLE